MKEKPHVYIGYIGTVNHDKHTLTYAIEMVKEEQKKKCEDSNDNSNKLNFNEGGIGMVKGFKNYTGSTILGYRFILNKNISKKNKFTKENSKIKNNMVHNKVKVLNKRRDYSK